MQGRLLVRLEADLCLTCAMSKTQWSIFGFVARTEDGNPVPALRIATAHSCKLILPAIQGDGNGLGFCFLGGFQLQSEWVVMG